MKNKKERIIEFKTVIKWLLVLAGVLWIAAGITYINHVDTYNDNSENTVVKIIEKDTNKPVE